jgi:hypothetical protein
LEVQLLDKTIENARILAAKLHAFRNAVAPARSVRELDAHYNIDSL